LAFGGGFSRPCWELVLAQPLAKAMASSDAITILMLSVLICLP
jgi:hypothetical protein